MMDKTQSSERQRGHTCRREHSDGSYDNSRDARVAECV